MNDEMLKYLVDNCDGESGAVELEDFKMRYPPSKKTAEDVKTLERLGYIVRGYADDTFYALIVTPKAINYFK